MPNNKNPKHDAKKRERRHSTAIKNTKAALPDPGDEAAPGFRRAAFLSALTPADPQEVGTYRRALAHESAPPEEVGAEAEEVTLSPADEDPDPLSLADQPLVAEARDKPYGGKPHWVDLNDTQNVGFVFQDLMGEIEGSGGNFTTKLGSVKGKKPKDTPQR